MFLIGGQTAGLIQTKHCTWIQLDPEIILGKSRSECLYRHENGGEGQRHGNAESYKGRVTKLKVRVPYV